MVFLRKKIFSAVVFLLVSAFAVLILFAGSGEHALAAQSKGSKAAPAAPTQVQLARGRYLVEHVAVCVTCHSTINGKGDLQPVAGRKGAGDYFPDETAPFRIIAPNITPDRETGAGTWTDAQFARAIREGVGNDGRRLFPVMPYLLFRTMSDQDLAAVIAYLRSLPPVKNSLPKTPVPPAFQAMIPPLMPVKTPVPRPDMSNPVKRGEYLASLALCNDCHTPVNEKGEPMMNLAFAGGRLLKGPWGSVHSANITPDASGISHYDEKQFIQMMRTGKVVGVGRKLSPIMLTSYFRGMTDDDLKAIYAWLKTLKPIRHRMDNTEPPTKCRICGGVHGLGDNN